MSNWISVKTALPTFVKSETGLLESNPVLAWQDVKSIKPGKSPAIIALVVKGSFFGNGPAWIEDRTYNEIDVVAWMPLPEEPVFENAPAQLPGQIEMFFKGKPSIREVRIRAGLTQEQVADKAGLSKTTVHKIERGGPFRRGTLRLICDALGVTLDDVAEGKV